MKHIACYGEGLIDFTQQREAFVPHPGGSPYNVAIALGRLGSSVEFCSQLSNDMFGKQLYHYLKNNHVGVQNVVFSDAPSTLAFVSTPNNAEPEYAFFSNDAADVALNEQSTVLKTGAEIHHFGSISLMQEPCGTYWEKAILSLEGFISFDPNIRPGLIKNRDSYLQRFNHVLSRTTLLKLSTVDLEWLAPEKTTAEFIQLAFSSGVRMVAITSGNEGAWLYTPEFTLHQQAMSVKVVDTIGAGDTFMAGFLSVIASLNGSLDAPEKNRGLLELALKTGCLAAALNCQEKGANPPFKEHLKTLLE